MRRSKARYVTACQQVLALGTVLAVLTPAANVISLDVVTRPAERRTEVATRPAPDRPQQVAVAPAPTAQRVERRPVEPEVREVPMTSEAPPARRSAPEAPAGGERVVSEQEEVEGFGAVGVTWSPESEVEDDEITVRVRTRTGDTWTGWTPVDYHDEHGPDPDSPEAENARPGTEPFLVGDVDEVQAEAVTEDGVAAPVDMKLAVVEPGGSEDSAVEEPEIDTATQPDGTGHGSEPQDTGTSAAGAEDEDAVALMSGATDPAEQPVDDALALQAAVTPKPKIFSRAQWGADERLRDKGSLRYFEVHAGFVHHTVNANNYSRDQVPGILRSIYAYHTRTRGWSDIGYNFLVDRFGRIWEGRYGGVDRPVVGAHTAGYNDHSFAMSAIGNFETAPPTSAMLDAYGRLMAWKLSLHGVRATATSQRVGSRVFPAINGHRDAGSTACPGRYLYAKLSTIRSLAGKYQAGWGGRLRGTNLTGTTFPDIVVRKRNGKGFVLPTEGLLRFKRPRQAGTGYLGFDTVVASPDLTGDRRADVLVRHPNGTAEVRPGNGSSFAASGIRSTTAFSGHDQITAVGDLDGNGTNDLVARNPGNGRLFLYKGRGNGAFDRVLLSRDWATYDLTIGAGDFNRDGKPDLMARRGNRLWFHPGTGGAALGTPVRVNRGDWHTFDTILGGGDFSGDGRMDLYVRSASTKKAYIFEGRGRPRVSWLPLGPYGRVGTARLLGAAHVVDSADPDVVAVKGDRLMVVPHRGVYNTGQKKPLGLVLSGADTVFTVGDWNGDGHGDVVSRKAGRMRLHRGRGDGTFAAPVDMGGFGGVELLAAVGDVTGDGNPDLMGQPSGKAMRIYPGNGGTGFRASYVARSRISAGQQIDLGLWDADGAPDSGFLQNGRITWLRGNGPGGLTGSWQSLSADLRQYDWVVAAGNVNAKGRPDLIVRKSGTGELWVLPGTKSGYGRPKFLAGGFKKYDLAG